MNISRRLFLERSAAISAVGAVSALPTVVEAKERQDRYARFTVEDNHAFRLARPGDVIFYDTTDREPVHGKIFVTLADKRQRLYLVRAMNFDGLWWAERFDDRGWYGPMDTAFFRQRIQGRATGMLRSLTT